MYVFSELFSPHSENMYLLVCSVNRTRLGISQGVSLYKILGKNTSSVPSFLSSNPFLIGFLSFSEKTPRSTLCYFLY